MPNLKTIGEELECSQENFRKKWGYHGNDDSAHTKNQWAIGVFDLP